MRSIKEKILFDEEGLKSASSSLEDLGTGSLGLVEVVPEEDREKMGTV